jgi:hypothetical protein
MTGKTVNTGKKKDDESASSDGGAKSPPPTPPARLTDGGDAVAGGATQQRMVRGDGGNWQQLTRTNYADWAVLMQVMLEGRFMWDAIENGTNVRSDDRLALEAILRGVPSEMMEMLAAKGSAKGAWDALKTMRLGVARVRYARAGTLAKQYAVIQFKDGETVDDFAIRVNGLVSQMALLGRAIPEGDTVRKMLSVLPRRYGQITLSIETLVDLDTLSIAELVGRPKAAEERYAFDNDVTTGMGGLLITE